ncbi:MAG: YhbY family RNA-binding protein [Nanoarchaeota archaeon]|nr:YhbY family RNA-binding protein [Nanoarchaeota archaeon]
MTVGLSQLGKNGITEGFITSLQNDFKKHVSIRISVLSGAGREREKVKKYSEEILDKLGKNYTSKIIGFVIIVRKWRKDVRE